VNPVNRRCQPGAQVVRRPGATHLVRRRFLGQVPPKWSGTETRCWSGTETRCWSGTETRCQKPGATQVVRSAAGWMVGAESGRQGQGQAQGQGFAGLLIFPELSKATAAIARLQITNAARVIARLPNMSSPPHRGSRSYTSRRRLFPPCLGRRPVPVPVPVPVPTVASGTGRGRGTGTGAQVGRKVVYLGRLR